MAKKHSKQHVAHVAHTIARPDDAKASDGFNCDDLHSLYERVSALEDLLEGLLPLFSAWWAEAQQLRRR